VSRALFVVFEGADMVGKTEQVERLRRRFESEGILVTTTSFPRYETPVGKAISRHLRGEISVVENDETLDLLHRAPEDDLYFEGLNCLDKMAAAAEIRSALAEGISVISSRYWQTSVVYAKDAGLDGAFMRRVYSTMPQADVNFLLDASLEVSLGRRIELRDRFERDRGKQERIRQDYVRMWSSAGGAGEGWSRILPGDSSAEYVHEAVWATLLGHSKMQELLHSRSSSSSQSAELVRLRELARDCMNLGFEHMRDEDAHELSVLLGAE